MSFLGSLYVFFSPIIFYDSINVIREIPMLTFVMAAYLLFLKKEDSYKKHVLLGILVGSAFLTKSVGFIYTFPIWAYYVFNKNKKVGINIASSVLFALPWAIWSYSHFQTPFVSHSAYLLPKIGSNISTFSLELYPYFLLAHLYQLFQFQLWGSKNQKIYFYYLEFLL